MLLRILTLFALALSSASAFVVINSGKSTTSAVLHRRTETKLYDTHPLSDRRDFLKQASLVVFGGGAALLGAPQLSFAKEEAIELTQENLDAAWKELENELNDPRGGVAKLQKMIDEEDWASILLFTKEYDLFLRKGKFGRCKLFMTKPEKTSATMLGNCMTFDLIGINQGAREKNRSQEQCNRYLNELRTDIGLAIERKATLPLPEPAV